MHTASFSINDSSAFGEVTSQTNRTIRLWCNEDRDLLHVAGPIDEEVLEHLRSTVGIQGQMSRQDEGIIVTEGCLRERSSGYLEEYAQGSGCLLVAPLRYERGEKRFQVVALKSSQISQFYHDLVDDGKRVTVDSKRELESVDLHRDEPLIAPSDMISDFTCRQREVLETAHDDGYYELPRKTTTAEIAKKLGITRRTVEEHLRRGEKKVMDGFVGQI
ncbi:MAG: helix-turn-helix domain-containing protein [Halobacteriota archaeon]|uniref:helix-turn-helix domain-containing protein n=1 Tax=Natronomonas sp. TaxID=2184060 RepID=UPI0039755C8F